MKRIVNVESGPGDRPGFVLDVYLVAAAYRAEVRDPEDAVLLSVTAGEVDGEGSVLESVRSFFAGRREDHLGAALVTEARAELLASGVDTRPAVDGIRLTAIIAERLRTMSAPDAPADIRLPAMDDDTRLLIAGHAATAVKLACDVREKQR